MIKLLGKIPTSFYLAVSGGMDSMVALDFFISGKYKPIILNFDYGTEFGKTARKFLRAKCKQSNLPLVVLNTGGKRFSEKDDQEEYWKNEKYLFFKKIPGVIVTAHTLTDSVEWWIYSSLLGESKLIPYKYGNIIRPFLLTDKKDIKELALSKNIEYLNEPPIKNNRSIIRKKILPQANIINPQIFDLIKSKIELEYKTHEKQCNS